jgi:hypothetical protein
VRGQQLVERMRAFELPERDEQRCDRVEGRAVPARVLAKQKRLAHTCCTQNQNQLCARRSEKLAQDAERVV